MEGHAPEFLVALEHSPFGAAIRQSGWIYPVANVGHILALVVFAGAVTVMDLRLLGAFASTPPARIVYPARTVAIGALSLQAATGFLLFTAEASHVAMNPVFQVKAALIAFGVFNALVVAGFSRQLIEALPAHAPLPGRLRTAAMLSLGTWILVAACGRLIAYL